MRVSPVVGLTSVVAPRSRIGRSQSWTRLRAEWIPASPSNRRDGAPGTPSAVAGGGVLLARSTWSPETPGTSVVNPGRYPTDVRSWGTPAPVLRSGSVVAGGPGRRRNNVVVLSCVVLSSPGPITSCAGGRGRALLLLGDPCGEGSDRQGTDHRARSGQNQAPLQPDPAQPFDQEKGRVVCSRLGLSGDVSRRCGQRVPLQSKRWRNSSNKNPGNLECRDLKVIDLVKNAPEKARRCRRECPRHLPAEVLTDPVPTCGDGGHPVLACGYGSVRQLRRMVPNGM